MPQLHDTGYGRAFFGRQLPDLIAALEKIGNNLANKQATQYPVCPSCAFFCDGAYSETCTGCVRHGCGSYQHKG